MGLMAVSANATVSITIQADDLLDQNSALVGVNSEGVMFVDTTTNGVPTGTLTAPFSIAIGAVIPGTGDKIVDLEYPNNGNGNPGELDFGATIALGGPFYQGQHVGVMWLPANLTPNSTAVPGWYGAFSDFAGAYSTAWVIPADGSNVSWDMTTLSQGGSVPNADGDVSGQIVAVPEPSTFMLIGVGLLGAFAFRRHRS